METSTTRRGLIKAAPIAALTVATPAVALAPPVANRREWEAAMADLAKIEAEDAAFTPGWWKAHKRCAAECEAVPHFTTAPSIHIGGQTLSTRDYREVRLARRDIERLDAGTMRLDPLPGVREQYELKRQLVREADARDHKVQAIRASYGMDAADDHAEELGDQLSEARDRLMSTPAPNLAALRWKLDQLREEDGDVAPWSADYVAQTFSDIARLLPEAR